MASRAEFAARIKEKYPQYASVDDSALVDRVLEKYPQYRNQITQEPAAEAPAPHIPEGAEAGESAARAIFPRSFQAEEQGVGLGRKVLAGGLDMLSLPGRTAASLNAPDSKSQMAPVGLGGMAIPVQPDAVPGRTQPDRGGMFETMADTKGNGLSQRIMRDPGLGAAVLAAPFTGGISLAGLGGTAARAALTGAASVAAHQGEHVLNGEGLKPGEALGEEAANIAIPVLGAKLAPVLKGVGVKIYNSVLKPSERTIKAGFAPSKAEVLKGTEALLETGHANKGGLAAANQSVEDRIDELASQIEDIITQKSRPQTVTTKAQAFTDEAAPKTGVNATGGVEGGPIYAGQAPRAALGSARALPESTVPEAPDVIRAGMNRPPQLPGPGPLVTPAPRPGATPPDVAVTLNRSPMPNQIDPRFLRPRATSTPNQPPIPDAPEGAAYGIPSGRNLPALPGQPAGPLVGRPQMPGAPPGPVATPLLGRPAGLPGQPLPEAEAMAGARPQGLLGSPPGTQENVIDVTKRISLPAALQRAREGFSTEMSAGEHAGLAEDLAKGADEWATDMKLSGKDAPVSPLVALKYQRGVGGMGKFDYGQNPQLVPAKARVANKLYQETGNDLQQVAPEIGPLRQEISKLIPMRMALTDAAARTDKNFAVGLRQAIAASAALTGAVQNGAEGALPALGLMGTIHASTSPRVGAAAFNAGKSLAKPSALRDAIKRWLLETVYAPGQGQSP